MNFQEIEKLRMELLSALPNLFGKTKLFKIVSFYSAVLATDDKNVIEAYSLDFIIEYLSELKLYTPFYQSPEKTVLLLSQLEKLKTVSTLSRFEKELMEIIDSIKHQLDLLIKILEGKSYKTSSKYLRFPVIESSSNVSNIHSFGSLESVNIKIHKTKYSNRFVFVPSGSKIEERLLQQVRISLEFALNYLSMHKHKFYKHHEVLVYFENLSANYEGNSLGVILTIGFIEQLSLLYNLPYVTHVTNSIATTGGVTESGKIIEVGKENIEHKTESVFYSEIETLVVPKEDENAASSKLAKLLKKHPNRKLSIVPISEIKDFINRRDLVDIKKQSPIVRTAKNILRNRVTYSLILIIILIVGFAWIIETDDNPSMVWNNKNTFYFANSSKKVLFKEIINFEPAPLNPIRFFSMIVDIDSDGKNEVLLSNTTNGKISETNGSLKCFTPTGIPRWVYQFSDTVYSEREDLYPPWDLQLIDTLTVGHRKLLYVIANNRLSYPGAIFTLDLKTGKRIGKIFWNSGHFQDGFLTKISGQQSLITGGCNNGFEQAFLMITNIHSLKGQAISRKDYLLKDIPLAKMSKYILLPKTDINQLKERYNYFIWLNYSEKDSLISFCTHEVSPQSGILYNYFYARNNFDLYIQDGLSISRDPLVRKGVLKQPFTDTREFREMMKNQIRFWDGNGFVKFNK